MVTPVYSNHHAEIPGLARFNTGDRILDNHTAADIGSQELCALGKDIRIWLAL